MVVPSLIDALQRPAKLSYIGLREEISEFKVDLEGSFSGIEDYDDACVLLSHIRSALSLCKGLIQYAVLPQSFPWSWARLLSPDPLVVDQCVADAKSTWELILKLEGSTDNVLTEFAKALFIKNIAVFREPMLMLAASGYVVTPQLKEYVAEMCSHISSSVSLEDCFLPLIFYLRSSSQQCPTEDQLAV